MYYVCAPTSNAQKRRESCTALAPFWFLRLLALFLNLLHGCPVAVGVMMAVDV